MKKVKTTDIITGVGYPPSKKGLDFLQQSYQEILAALAQTFAGNVPSTTVGYVLYGVVKTDLGSNNYSYTAGAIYFNGEVYPVDAQASISLATGKALNITVTNDATADPTTFSDGSSKNVHNVRKLTFANSATGDLLYGNLVFVQDNDTWHTVGSAGEPAFQNSWTGFSPVKYRKEGNMVHLRGVAENVGSLTTTVFTLPVGYRPSQELVFAAAVGGAVDTFKSAYISTNGNVQLSSGAASGAKIAFYISYTTL